jgi:hypothetical protein
VQVPTAVALNVDPLTEQPAVPAEVTAYVTAPVLDPPLVVNETVDPKVPVVDVIEILD